MKKIISLLFATLLIVSCGSSDGGNDNKGKTVNIPGSSTAQSTTITNNTTKPKVIPACESGMSVPGCS